MPSLAELTDSYPQTDTGLPVEQPYLGVPQDNDGLRRVYITGNTAIAPAVNKPITDDRPEPRPEPLLSEFNTKAGKAVDKILNKLTGSSGEERYQLWPEKVVREGVSGAHDIIQPNPYPNGSEEHDWFEDQRSKGMVPAALAISALAGTGGLAGADASLGSTAFLRPALKYENKIYKAPVGGQHLDALPAHLADEFQRLAMSGEDINHYNFGFMNHKGQFLNRESALDYAIKEGLVDPSAGQYGALTSTLMADSSKPGTAIESLAKSGQPLIIRGAGAEIGHESLAGLTKPDHFYRGMSEAEYNNTIGSGKPIKSNESSSLPGEGTNFSHDIRDAESYANFGRDDPRKTGKPNYLVEVKGSDGLTQHRDGYFKAAGEIGPDRVTSVIKMEPKDNAIVGKVLKADSSKEGAALQANKPAFYSALEHNVNQILQSKMTGDQWLGTLSNKPGVKPEELQWTGLKEFLQSKGKEPVTKAELQEHLQGNKVELKEVSKGWDAESKAKALKDFEKEYERPPFGEGELTSWANKSTKYHSYQLPGGEPNSYREMLLTLPKDAVGPLVAKRQALDTRIEELRDSMRGTSGTNEIRAEIRKAQIEKDIVNGRLNDAKAESYQSSHWDEPNILAHVRMNDRNMPVEFTAEQKAALAAHEAAASKLEALRKEQGETAKDINFQSRSLEYDRQTKIRSDMESGKISKIAARKQIEDYVEHPELKPLQDKLEVLRAKEDALRKSLPEKPIQQNLKSLHIEELQSDMMQTGRDKGFKSGFHPEDFDIKELPDKKGFELRYKGNPDQFGKKENFLIDTFKNKGDANAFIRKGEIPERLSNVLSKDMRRGEIPDAPFEKNWHELALKRMIREAAEKGYDRLSWTPGEAQAARYDLSKSVDHIEYNPKTKNLAAYDKNGSQVIDKRDVTHDNLADFVGKEAAEKIKNTKPKGEFITLENADLKIGGEGMKGFYDQIIPKALEKISGEKVKSTKAKETIVSIEKTEDGYAVSHKDNPHEYEGVFDTKKEAEDFIKEEFGGEGLHDPRNSTPIHYIDIPQSLKDTAMHKGFPLFSSTHMFIPVDHTPDFGDNK